MMRAPSVRQRRRGATMIELMMAAAILVIGLTGIVGLLMRSMAVARNGVSSANSVAVANSSLQEITALGYGALAAGGLPDGGEVRDEANRRYVLSYDLSPVDAGIGTTRAFLVTVNVQWWDTSSITVPQTTTVTGIVSAKLDGG